MPGIVEISGEFRFDAAHYFAAHPAGHPYRRMHGHSFRVEIALRGVPDSDTGFVVDFGELEQAVANLRDRLDHNLLNEIAGLERPSLENIAIWIWNQLERQFHGLARVTVHRDSCGQHCTYSGAAKPRRRTPAKVRRAKTA